MTNSFVYIKIIINKSMPDYSWLHISNNHNDELITNNYDIKFDLPENFEVFETFKLYTSKNLNWIKMRLFKAFEDYASSRSFSELKIKPHELKKFLSIIQPVNKSGEGTIYLLVNPSIPDTLKVGITSRSIENRIKELRSTGVPEDFFCIYASKVMGAYEIEQRILNNFDRLDKKREFIKTHVNLWWLLQFHQIEEITPNGILQKDNPFYYGISSFFVKDAYNGRKHFDEINDFNYNKLNIALLNNEGSVYYRKKLIRVIQKRGKIILSARQNYRSKDFKADTIDGQKVSELNIVKIPEYLGGLFSFDNQKKEFINEDVIPLMQNDNIHFDEPSYENFMEFIGLGPFPKVSQVHHLLVLDLSSIKVKNEILADSILLGNEENSIIFGEIFERLEKL